MSCYNLKLKIWRKDNQTRIYITTRWCNYRAGISAADGHYFQRGERGEVLCCHSRQYVRGLGEENSFAMYEVMRLLSDMPRNDDNRAHWIDFDTLLTRIEASQTKKGNFSLLQYEKRFQLQSTGD
jgi:hypothetical protein